MALLSDQMSRRLGLTSLEDERLAAVRPWISGRLLDIGSGNSRLVHEYGDGIGVDVHDFGGDALLLPDTTQLPFAAETFDTVTFVAILNHIPERSAVLRESRRVLRGGSRIVVTMIAPLLPRSGTESGGTARISVEGACTSGRSTDSGPRRCESFCDLPASSWSTNDGSCTE
jgi:SAM-dependent methyltransferase